MNGSGEFGILDKQIDVLRTGGILPEKDILSLCKKVRERAERELWMTGHQQNTEYKRRRASLLCRASCSQGPSGVHLPPSVLASGQTVKVLLFARYSIVLIYAKDDERTLGTILPHSLTRALFSLYCCCIIIV